MPAAAIMELFWIWGNIFKSIDRITSIISSAAMECLVLAFVKSHSINHSLSALKNVGLGGIRGIFAPVHARAAACKWRSAFLYLAPVGFAFATGSISELYLPCPEYTISSILSASRASDSLPSDSVPLPHTTGTSRASEPQPWNDRISPFPGTDRCSARPRGPPPLLLKAR